MTNTSLLAQSMTLRLGHVLQIDYASRDAAAMQAFAEHGIAPSVFLGNQLKIAVTLNCSRLQWAGQVSWMIIMTYTKPRMFCSRIDLGQLGEDREKLKHEPNKRALTIAGLPKGPREWVRWRNQNFTTWWRVRYLWRVCALRDLRVHARWDIRDIVTARTWSNRRIRCAQYIVHEKFHCWRFYCSISLVAIYIFVIIIISHSRSSSHSTSAAGLRLSSLYT